MQPGGLELQVTLLDATTGQPLSDTDNPRGEVLFFGAGDQPIVPTVLLTDQSSHTFKFKVMLLSSDIHGALVRIKVAPPNAADDDPLCVITRAFKSRARHPGSDATAVVAAADDDDLGAALLAHDTNHGLQTDSLSIELDDDNGVLNFASGINTTIDLGDDVVDVDDDDDDDDDLDGDLDGDVFHLTPNDVVKLLGDVFHLTPNDVVKLLAAPSSSSSSGASSSSSSSASCSAPPAKKAKTSRSG